VHSHSDANEILGKGSGGDPTDLCCRIKQRETLRFIVELDDLTQKIDWTKKLQVATLGPPETELALSTTLPRDDSYQ
jgi:hypothetical protein